MQKIKKHLLPIILFLIISSVFMGPSIIKPSQFLYAEPGVPYTAVWWGWWRQYSEVNELEYFHPDLQGAPFGADYSHYPVQPLRWFYDRFFIFLNEITAYNLIIFVGFFTSAISIYIIAYILTQRRGASIIAGLIFSFCPFHIMQSTMNLWLATTQWIPIYFLSLFLLFTETFHNWKKRLYPPMLSAVFFILVLFENYYYGYMAFLLTVFTFLLYILWFCFKHSKRNFKIKPWFIFGLLCFLLALIPIISILTNLQAARNGLITSDDYIRSADDLDPGGARWFYYFIPPSSHPIWGEIFKNWNNNNSESVLFVGLIPLLLAGYAVYIAYKKRRMEDNGGKAVIFFGIIVILSFLFSLQENLNLFGIKILPVSYYFHKIFPMFRVYARFGIFIMLGLSILAALGLKELSIKKRRCYFLLVPVLILLIILEFINFPPYPIIKAQDPPEVYQWLHDQSDNQIIIEYPLAGWDTSAHYQYLFWQRYHHIPFFNGVRPGSEGYEYFERVKSINQDSVQDLTELGIKYIIIHQDFFNEERSLESLNKIKDLKFVKTFDSDLIYEIQHTQK